MMILALAGEDVYQDTVSTFVTQVLLMCGQKSVKILRHWLRTRSIGQRLHTENFGTEKSSAEDLYNLREKELGQRNSFWRFSIPFS